MGNLGLGRDLNRPTMGSTWGGMSHSRVTSQWDGKEEKFLGVFFGLPLEHPSIPSKIPVAALTMLGVKEQLLLNGAQSRPN